VERRALAEPARLAVPRVLGFWREDVDVLLVDDLLETRGEPDLEPEVGWLAVVSA
jgi:hypothetical protein